MNFTFKKEERLHKKKELEVLFKDGSSFFIFPFKVIHHEVIKNELADGSLINLLPKHELIRTLYWHRWVLVKGVFKKISEAIIESGIKALN